MEVCFSPCLTTQINISKQTEQKSKDLSTYHYITPKARHKRNHLGRKNDFLLILKLGSGFMTCIASCRRAALWYLSFTYWKISFQPLLCIISAKAKKLGKRIAYPRYKKYLPEQNFCVESDCRATDFFCVCAEMFLVKICQRVFPSHPVHFKRLLRMLVFFLSETKKNLPALIGQVWVSGLCLNPNASTDDKFKKTNKQKPLHHQTDIS